MGEFAKRAAELPEWEAALAAQEGRLRQRILPSHEEARQKADALLEQLREAAYRLGWGLRAQRQDDAGVQRLTNRPENPVGIPGKEVLVALPGVTKAAWFESRMLSKEALFGFLTDPVKQRLEEAKLDVRHSLDKAKTKATRVTSDPSTLPEFYPSVALTAPREFMRGYRSADQALDTKLKRDMEAKLEAARREFERALTDEYQSSRKAASAGEMLDGLAQWHLAKKADGEANQLMGTYLALASLLGAGTHMAAKGWVESRDPRYQQLKAMRDLIKQRQRATPAPVFVANELPDEESEEAASVPELQSSSEAVTA